MEEFRSRAGKEHFKICGQGRIVENDYNLSVSTYVKRKIRGEVVDINALNGEIGGNNKKDRGT